MFWLILAALGGTVYLASRTSVNQVSQNNQGNQSNQDSPPTITDTSSSSATPPLSPGRTYLFQVRIEGILPPASGFVLPETPLKEILRRMGFTDPFIFVYPFGVNRVTPASRDPNGPVLFSNPEFNELTVLARFTGPFNPDSNIRLESYTDLGMPRIIQKILLENTLNAVQAAQVYNALAYNQNSDNLGLIIDSLRLLDPIPILAVNLIQAKRAVIGDV